MAVRLARVLAAALLALTACASGGGPSDPGAASRRVVVAPLNLGVRAPETLAGKGEPVRRELLRYLQAQDRQVAVLAPESATALWRAATRDLDLSDRSAALRTAYSRLARRLAEHRDYDLLVVPSLVLRPGHLQGWYASWDGVQRPVPSGAVAMSTGLDDLMNSNGAAWVSGLRGKVAAVSLHVSVLRPDGTPVHEGLGGLALIQSAHTDDPWDGPWTFETRADPFSRPEDVREGVERAFQRPLLASAPH